MTKDAILTLKSKIEKLNSHRFIVNAKKNIESELQAKGKYKDISCEITVKYSWHTDTPVNVKIDIWATHKYSGIRGGFESSKCGKTLKSAINSVLKSFNYFYGLNVSIYEV